MNYLRLQPEVTVQKKPGFGPTIVANQQSSAKAKLDFDPTLGLKAEAMHKSTDGPCGLKS